MKIVYRAVGRPILAAAAFQAALVGLFRGGFDEHRGSVEADRSRRSRL
jgi:hypothetical protein